MRKQKILGLLSILCILALLFSGCENLPGLGGTAEETEPAATLATDKTGQYRYGNILDFSEMEYVRPDIEAYQRMVQDLCAAAKTESAEELVDRVLELYDSYDNFYTMDSLADIRYSMDLRDTYFQEEYSFCSEQSAVISQGIEECYMALAQSPVLADLERDEYFGAGFFDSYQDEGMWTEEFSRLMTLESTLVAESYAVMSDLSEMEYYSDAYFEAGLQPLGELMVELIQVRQEIAACAGYDSYEEFAFDYNYERDYSPEEAEEYLGMIQAELTPLYRALNESDFWWDAYGAGNTPESCHKYLKAVTEAMGGRMRSAYSLMEEKSLCDLTASPYKYMGSFEVYLTSFSAPFVFLNPSGDNSDYLAFAHEFGHFANDLFRDGSTATTDVSEIFSQGMEYLSLCYGPDEMDMEALRRLKLADSLNTYIEQAAYARFESEIYKLTGDELTVENLSAVYEEICTAYGFDTWNWDNRDWITINHFFTAPFYILSYVTSNDAAMQLYEMELAEPGEGLELYTRLTSDSPDQFMDFIGDAELESPFAPERLDHVAKTIESALGLA